MAKRYFHPAEWQCFLASQYAQLDYAKRNITSLNNRPIDALRVLWVKKEKQKYSLWNDVDNVFSNRKCESVRFNKI